MTTTDALALAASVVACLGAIVAIAAAAILVSQVRRLERGIDELRHEALAVMRDARTAAGQATAELARVDAVLSDTESVTATVDHAARLTERAFANPVVKVLAWRAGASGALRRLAQPAVAPEPGTRRSIGSGRRRSVDRGATHRRRHERRPAGPPAREVGAEKGRAAR